MSEAPESGTQVVAGAFLPRHCVTCNKMIKTEEESKEACARTTRVGEEEPHTLVTYLEVMTRQQAEWKQMAEDAVYRAGPGGVSAAEVTLAQLSRMADRGERPITLEEMQSTFDKKAKD